MPEGPEIRRQADRVRRAVGGEIARQVVFGLPRLEAEGPALSGRRVRGVDSRGKALLVHFEGGASVFCHSNLYGRWYFVNAGQSPRTGRQLRFGVDTEAKRALLYSASAIDVLPTERLPEHPFLAKLGPDVLDPEVSPAAVEARLEASRFRRRNLAGLLLDQGFVAGIGNYLRSEILFFAGILPELRPADLQPGRRRRLAEAIVDVTRRAYRTGGITIETELDDQLKADGLTKRQRRHHVFAREGRICRRCETPIEKRTVAGRRLYLCPGCQT